MKVLIIVGTRPNFIKVTRFRKVSQSFDNLDIEILHTGQHYDRKMAHVFFEQFGLMPDYFLTLSGSTPSGQMGNMLNGISQKIVEIKPDYILVPGDVNSTLAGALAANRDGIRLGHLESGLRSFDRTMPEEINRILVDQITNDFFVTEQSGLDNLAKEGLSDNLGTSTNLVGNTMIDTLVEFSAEIEKSQILTKHRLADQSYVLMTMHRPATVDNISGLKFLSRLLKKIAASQKVIWPIHPRTLNNLHFFNLKSEFESISNLVMCDPLDYFSFQRLIKGARTILTDSGGIQEESTFCQVPCITLRPNTERPVTCEIGTNQLIGLEEELILDALKRPKAGDIPPLWDGHTTERVIKIMQEDC